MVSTRALAYWRICLGLICVWDVCRHWSVAKLFYLPGGAYPLKVLGAEGTYRLGPFTWFPSEVGMHLTFFFALLASLALTVGIRWSNAVVLIMIASLHLRAFQMLTGGEAVLLLQLTYSLLLPVFEKYALQNRISPRTQRSWVSNWAYPLVLSNLAVNYAFNTYNKSSESWKEGTAVARSLGYPGMTTDFGTWVAEAPAWLLSGATTGTLLIEGLLPLLILTPLLRRHAHRLAAALMFSLHVGIWTMLDVGIFSPTMLAHLPLLLIPRRPHTAAGPSSKPRSLRLTYLHRGLVLLLAYVMCAKVERQSLYLGQGQESEMSFPLPGWLDLASRFLGIHQGWGMFLSPPDRDFVAVTYAKTKSGRVFDPWRREASGNSKPLSRLDRSLVRSHIYHRYEGGLLDEPVISSAFTDWVLKQAPTEKPDDRVESFYSWSFIVPAEKTHQRKAGALDKELGRLPLPLRGALETNLKSEGVLFPDRSVDGHIVPDGTSGISPVVSPFSLGCAHLRLDLPTPSSVATLFLQSDAIDQYIVEVSVDGENFEALGYTKKLVARGLQSRVLQLNTPLLRSVRIRPLKPRALRHFISEVALFEHTVHLPSLPKVKTKHFIAAWDRPAAIGLLAHPSSASGKCPWPAEQFVPE